MAAETLDRVWAAITIVAVFAVLAFSDVDLTPRSWNWLVHPLSVGYAVSLVAVIVAPQDRRWYGVGLILGVLFWGHRAGGFAVEALAQDRTDFANATAERLSALAMAFALHVHGWRRIQARVLWREQVTALERDVADLEQRLGDK